MSILKKRLEAAGSLVDSLEMPEDVAEQLETWRADGPIVWAEGHWIMRSGALIHLTDWQWAVLNLWWRHRETTTTLAISNVKKTGKTTLNAVLTAWRWLALPGEHFCAGNDLDQSTGLQFQMIADMVSCSLYLSANVHATNKKLTFTPTGSTLAALAVDAAGNAGANHLSVSHTEAWGVIYETGIRAYEELTPPPGKTYGLPAMRVIDSYAGYEGESETWHGIVDRGLAGERVSDDWPIYRDAGLLLVHLEGEEARERCFRGDADEAAVYYDEQQRDLRVNAFTRMHDNKRTVSESKFVTPDQWAACYSPDVQRWGPGDRRRLVLGADASTSRDLTALVGCWYNPVTARTEVVYCHVWRPEQLPGGLRGGRPTVDLEQTIGAEVLRLRRLRVVEAVYYDPYQLHVLALAWERAGLQCEEFPQTAQRIEADQGLYDAIIAETVAHYNDPVLNEHMENAVALETQRGFRLAKEKARKPIDAAVALSMAVFGAVEVAYGPGRLRVPGLRPFAGVGRPGQESDGTLFVTGRAARLSRGNDANDPQRLLR